MPKPRTDQRSILIAAIAAPLIVIFVSQLLEMDMFMSLILGVLVVLRVLFAHDKRVVVAVLLALLVWAIYLPLAHEENSEFLGIAVLALAYSVMALGLNIIVGYAGLLDLGYVAFFALGALTAGWFMSGFYSEAGEGGNGVHFLVSDPAASLPGIHLNFLVVVVIAVIICTIAGMLIGLPTLRLRGDYIAIVTLAFGEIIGRIVINGDQLHYNDVPALGGGLESIFGAGANFSNGRQGITPIDKIDLPFSDPFRSLDLRAVVLGGARDGPARAVRELPPARLQARARVDRAARGRGRGRVHGRAAREDEAAGLRHGRGLRRHLGRVPRLDAEHRECRPVPVLLLDLHPGDGHPRRPRLDRGRADRRLGARLPELQVHPRRERQAARVVRHRARHVRAVRGDLRLPARDDDGAAASGPDPRAKTGARDGRARGHRRHHRRRRPADVYEARA